MGRGNRPCPFPQEYIGYNVDGKRFLKITGTNLPGRMSPSHGRKDLVSQAMRSVRAAFDRSATSDRGSLFGSQGVAWQPNLFARG